jgi:OFA family oxalate/formate antiporter-like MFS transporter
MEKNKIKIRWLYLVVSVIALLFAGIIYAWSILKVPLAAEFKWNNTQLALNFTLTVGFFVIGGFLSGLISKKTSPMIRLLISAALFFAGFMISSQLRGSLFVLYLSYGVLAGLGIGFLYNAVISVINAWFPDKRGLASGLLLTGFALNSLVIGKIASHYLATPDQWRTTYMTLAIITTAVIVIAAIIIKNPPAGLVLPAPKGAVKKNQAETTALDLTPGQMLKRLSFWKFFVFFMLLASVGAASIAFAKDIIIAVKDPSADELKSFSDFAVTMVGIISIGNGFGRLLSGWLFDAIGRRKTQYVTSAVAIAGPLIVFLALTTHSVPIGIIGLIICYISYGFAPTLSATYIGSFYGQRFFSVNLGILNLQLALTAFAATFEGALKDATGGFQWTFIILAGLSVLGLILNLSIKKP